MKIDKTNIGDKEGNVKEVSKGVAFLSYKNAEDAMKAIQEMNGKVIAGKPIYVSVFMNKQQRKHLLENYFNNKSMMGGMGSMQGFPMGGHQQQMMQRGMNPMGMMMGGRGGMMTKPMGKGMMPQQMMPQNMQMGGNMMPMGMTPNLMAMGHKQPNPQQQTMPQQSMGFQQQQRGGAQVNNRKMAPQMQYTNKARNVNVQQQSLDSNPINQVSQQQPLVQQNQQQQQSGDQGMANFSREFYNKLDEKEKKQYLGELIYPFVYAREPTAAAKITGMLLEIDDEELIKYTKSTDKLIVKIDEAENVLKRYQAGQGDNNRGGLGGGMANRGLKK